MDFKDNHIEWITGDNRITVTLTQKRFINRVLKLAKKHEDAVEIVANNADGSLCAHLPINALHLFILPSKTGEVSAVHDILEEEAEEEKA